MRKKPVFSLLRYLKAQLIFGFELLSLDFHFSPYISQIYCFASVIRETEQRSLSFTAFLFFFPPHTLLPSLHKKTRCLFEWQLWFVLLEGRKTSRKTWMGQQVADMRMQVTQSKNKTPNATSKVVNFLRNKFIIVLPRIKWWVLNPE